MVNRILNKTYFRFFNSELKRNIDGILFEQMDRIINSDSSLVDNFNLTFKPIIKLDHILYEETCSTLHQAKAKIRRWLRDENKFEDLVINLEIRYKTALIFQKPIFSLIVNNNLRSLKTEMGKINQGRPQKDYILSEAFKIKE